jgi:DNA repair exonuclease SbcCD nuclease subunit
MILCVGDLHLKTQLGYADCVKDGRKKEREEVLNFIVKQAKDCDKVVFLGDNFDGKNNPSEVIREFTAFLERFKKKEIFILAGNHETKGDGSTAIDYLKEINNPHWHIITRDIYVKDNLFFLPWIPKTEMGLKDNEEGRTWILSQIYDSLAKNPVPNPILFAHYAISGTESLHGTTDLFDEVVLPREYLQDKFKMIVAGHIHNPSVVKNSLITGSVFREVVGEAEKYIYTINDNMEVDRTALPGRNILPVIYPQNETHPEKINGDIVSILGLLESFSPNIIVKFTLKYKLEPETYEKLVKMLKMFDGYVLVEQYQQERKKTITSIDTIDTTSIEDLISLYSKEKGADLEKLKYALNLLMGQ